MPRVFLVFLTTLPAGWAQDVFEPLGQEAEMLETIEVVASTVPSESPLRFLPAETVSGETLQRLAQGTLGDTLGWQPGVNTNSYGQGSSRPVIRGFDGYRVRILRDSVGTLDVSSASPDHGLPLEPLLLREVEILRGPAALRFGNSALGGAVNTRTRTFLTEMPGRRFSGAFESRFDSVSSGLTQAGYLNFGMDDFVVTFTGSYREAGDYDIPGRARTSAYEARFSPLVNDPVQGTTVPIENPGGTLPNTDHRSSSYSLGLSWLPEFLPVEASLAYSRFDSDFGLPYLFGGDPNDLFGNSSLEMAQDRFDLRLRYLGDHPWLTEARLHFGYGDYSHEEQFTGRGKDLALRFTDTRFDLEAWELRLDLNHEPTDWLRGTAGFQVWGQDLAPSFLAGAPNENSRFGSEFETVNFGLFAQETATVGLFDLNAALRWETQTIKDQSLASFGFVREVRDTSLSAILGGSWEEQNIGPFDRLGASLNASLVERLPSESERFAFWRNPGIQRFLIGGDLDGDPLETEQALGLDLGFEATVGKIDLSLNLFHYQIDDFIFLQDLVGIGNQAGYTQRDARFYGFEAQADYPLLESGDHELLLSLMADGMRAGERGSGAPLPRIPPLRLGTRVQWDQGPYRAGLEIRYAFAQDRVQKSTGVVQGELPTDGYTEVNLDFSYDWELPRDTTLTVFAQIRNLLDEDRRLHTSFVKDVTPLPGRNLTLGGRLTF